MSLTTASTTFHKSITLADIEEAVRKVKDFPSPEWFLCDPNGRIWSGKPEELLQVLLPYHPLLQLPMRFDHRVL
jgi:hypothetical protein